MVPGTQLPGSDMRLEVHGARQHGALCMDLNDLLRSQGGIDAIANQLGIPAEQAERGAAALLPSILEGFGNRVGEEGESGVGGIGAILDALGGAGLARNVIGPEPTEVSKGNDILGQIFGSKEVSREVAG